MILSCVDLTGWTRDSVLCQAKARMLSTEYVNELYACLLASYTIASLKSFTGLAQEKLKEYDMNLDEFQCL